MPSFRSLVTASLLACQALAGDDEWLSPVYKEIFQNKLPFPPDKAPKTSYFNETTKQWIDYYEIEIKEFEQTVYKGLKPAKLVGYDGISPGPTFRMEKDREAVVRFVNQAPMDISVHLHGSYSRAPFDGWAEDVTKKGQYKDYYYPNHQNARTLWYHDHAVHHTAENAYFGQAGFYILHDPAEDALGLPSGPVYDLPLALSAKQYNSDGTLFSPAQETTSLYGDVIHVNGQPWPFHNVEPRKYRLRFLDTAISRAFKLTFEDGTKKVPFHVIAADAGLLTKPVQSDTLEIAMAERWEIVIDFSAYAGKNITVKNSRDVQADEDYNSTDKVMRFVVGKDVSSQANNGPLPPSLRTVKFPPKKDTVDRHFKFERSGGQWVVNGVSFADVNNRILAKPARGAVEVWELENSSGGWSHPVHIHLVDFQVLSRTGGKRSVLPYEREALKDVVLLGTGETVRVIARYAPWDGVYMFHCHNLIHEDHDMMAAFNVTSLADWGYDETTKITDPMDERFRAKDVSTDAFSAASISDRLAQFAMLDAYKDPDKVEAALESYWANGGPKPTTLATSARSASSGAASSTAVRVASGSSTITRAPVATSTSTRRSDDSTRSSTRRK
ncbi:oxidase cueO precursor [Massariosphaeria phaeospora]|uniref:Oxidase cueO n=1 Tax=Massariosphaeria phaeospora TaxID=100035 RepID=A0A7C8IC65_9PLEO|nr:oxidase cueO precursor [Massariosphaeria phaeospora]